MDAAGAPPPMPPCIDDFDVGQELGKGGFAVVYRARVRSTGLEVALKVVDKHRACEHLSGGYASGGAGEEAGGGGGLELACARVANEVRLHWGLKHPAVVELLEFFEDERFVYLVLQLCGGGDLYRRLRESGRGGAAGGPLDEREAAGYMGQLLAGLQYLHESGVMHRDLKLSNLLLSEDGRRLRIGDFGLAVKLEEEDSERNTICGTPNYMAPEVQGEAYGLSADLWSAGCLFYAMVTGGAPFQGRRVGDTLANARSGRYVVPEGLSDAAKDFLACMLSKDPTRRMRVEEAAAHPFLRLDNHHPPRGLAAIPPTKPTTPGGKNLATATHAKAGGAGKGRKQTTNGRKTRAVSSNSRGKSGRLTTSDTAPFRGKPGATEAGGAAAAAAAATAAGHSTLTASTAGLGSSDLCSVNSGFLLDGEEFASFTTLRAEAVPTPATIGEGATAAAARVRRAAAQAPFRASVAKGAALGATEATAGGRGGARGGSGGGGGGGREARARRRTAQPPFEVERDRSADGSDSERDAGRGLVVRSTAAGGELRGRFGWRGPADVTVVAAASGRGDGTGRGRGALGSDEARAQGKTGLGGGGLVRRGNARGAGVGDEGWKSPGGGRVSSDPGGSLAEAQGDPGGVAAFYADKSETRDPSIEETRQKQQKQQRHRRKQQQPPRRRTRRARSTQVLPDKQRGPTTAVTGDRAGRTRPSGGSSSSSEGDLPFAPLSGSPARRRRQRKGGRGASRPPPPLPPQPPSQPPIQLLPPGERPHASDDFPRRLRELREVRAAAAAARRLHGNERAGSDASAGPASKAVGDKSLLVPFSTARVKPVSHRSGGKAAGVRVFADGRAGITVGRRWLVASESGERVWAGVVPGAASAEYSPGEMASVSRVGGGSGRAMRSKEDRLAAAVAKAGSTDAADEEAAGYSLRSLPEEFRPLYRSLAGIVNTLRSKTPKVVLRREPPQAEAAARAHPGDLTLCALMDNLPDPDFAAAFAGGGSLSLWTRKNELRVELPSGRVRRWVVGPGSEWPAVEDGGIVVGGEKGDSSGGRDGGNGSVGSGGAGYGSAEEAVYLTAGFEGYCRCLREEAAAYQRRASFPVEVCAPPAASLPASTAGAAAAAAAGGGKVRPWWRGEEDSSSSSSSSSGGGGSASSESPGVQDDEHGFNSDGGCEGWVGGGGGGSFAGRGTDWSDTLSPEASGEHRRHSINDDRPGGRPANDHHDLGHHGRYSDPQQHQQQQDQQQRRQQLRQQQQWQRRHQEPTLTPSPVLETPPPTPKPGAVTPAAPWPAAALFVAAGQKYAKRAGESLVSSSDCSARSEGGERACPDTSSLTCSSISEGRPVAGGGEGGWGKDNPVRGSGPVAPSRDGGAVATAAAAVIPGLGEAFRNGDGGLEVRFTDGVEVAVDAKAKWMRVTRPPPPGHRQQQHQHQHQHQQENDSTRAFHPLPEMQSATYDLGRRAAERRKGTRGAGRESAERMPRDVKDRMKVLPRFIAVLKGTPAPPANERSPAGQGGVRVRGDGRDAVPPL